MDAVAAVESDATEGLSPEQANQRLQHFGPNALRETRRRSLLAVFIGQFKSPLIYLLFIAAAIALALGHSQDAAVIFAVVLLNSIIGTIQEGRAERSLAALRKLATQKARVVRGGQEILIEARDVVPGDILLLEAGDAVIADGHLLDGAALQIAEAALTGESLPVSKNLLPLAPDTPLAHRQNMVYAGTHVTAGRARVVVVATGLATEVGHIATLAETAEEPKTPLELRVAQFGRYIIVAAGIMFVLVNVIGILRDIPFTEILMIAISQLVGMVPEGLPVAMTIALAVGVQRMSRRNAIIRRLSAVETLGSTTVICSDKTGTLTRNEMTATAIYLADGTLVSVTGSGFEPVGSFLIGERQIDVPRQDGLVELLEAITLCNDAQLQGPTETGPRWHPLGDPTEVALLSLAIKGGVVPDELRGRAPRRAEIPFDPAAKMMATQHSTDAETRVIIKGAPEAVLELCRKVRKNGVDAALDANLRQSLNTVVEHMGAQALRVLAVAVVDGQDIEGHAGLAAFQGRGILLGLVGQLDPPRAEAKGAVASCRAAGIRAVMVTGDHKATGLAIARELGIARDGDAAIDGSELELLSDAELADEIENIAVFARVHPAQKLRIVEAYQQQHEVVAMTGDGVNDAPALARADVGVAMGLSGTEVAKEAAKIVIGDDNFASIVAAIEEGRVVYRNIKKVVLYVFSTCLAEVLVLLSALLLGYPPPLAAVQILWIDLVTEGTVTVNLIMEPAEGDEMRLRPVPSNEPLLTRTLLIRMAFMTTAIISVCVGWYLYRSSLGLSFAQVQTETFTLLAVCQWFNVLNCRSERHSALSWSILQNPWIIGGLAVSILLQGAVIFYRPLGELFYTTPLSTDILITIAILASAVLWVEELRKFVVRWHAGR